MTTANFAARIPDKRRAVPWDLAVIDDELADEPIDRVEDAHSYYQSHPRPDREIDTVMLRGEIAELEHYITLSRRIEEPGAFPVSDTLGTGLTYQKTPISPQISPYCRMQAPPETTTIAPLIVRFSAQVYPASVSAQVIGFVSDLCRLSVRNTLLHEPRRKAGAGF